MAKTSLDTRRPARVPLRWAGVSRVSTQLESAGSAGPAPQRQQREQNEICLLAMHLILYAQSVVMQHDDDNRAWETRESGALRESASQEGGDSGEGTSAHEASGSPWVSRRAAASAAYQAARKEAQRQAYQKAKQRRAKDPRYLQLKEAAKARRREHYERVKQHRKAAQALVKAARSAQRASTECEARACYEQGRVRVARATAPRRLEAVVSALVAHAVVANDVS